MTPTPAPTTTPPTSTAQSPGIASATAKPMHVTAAATINDSKVRPTLAARQQREHQRLAATVFPEGNRSLALLSGVPEQDRAAAQSTPAEDLGLRNPCR